MSHHELTKAEEGTPDVDALLALGWEPFAVVSTPVTEELSKVASDGQTYSTGEWKEIGHVNVIWFRRVLA